MVAWGLRIRCTSSPFLHLQRKATPFTSSPISSPVTSQENVDVASSLVSQDISMEVHTSVWRYTYQYEGTHISMEVHTSVWRYTHQYGGTHISMEVHTSIWRYTHQY